MTKANQPGYLLPEVPQPDENICICVPVPKDWRHIQAFLGQIMQLGYWYSWERDSAHTGKLAAEVWREIYECISDEVNCAMTTGCGCGGDRQPTRTRINPETGAYEVSYDDGATWEADPGADPRESGLRWPPNPGDPGDEKKCAAANSIIGFLEETQQGELAQLEASADIADMVAALIGVAAAIGLAFGAVPGAILGLFALVVNQFGHMIAGDFESQFSETTWDDLLCILYCQMDEDGGFNNAGWIQIKADVKSWGTYAGFWLENHINLFGVVGLTNAGRANYPGSRECDCPCNDCSSLENWDVIFGTILEQSPGFLRIQSVDNGSGQHACRLANYSTGGCCAVTYEVVSGVATNQAYYPCGSETPIFSVPPAETCMYDVNVNNIFLSPLIVEFTFTDCP